MRWPVFLIVAIALLIAETSLQPVFAVRSLASIAPSFLAVLAAYVSLLAPRIHALWAAWLAGLLLDLFVLYPHEGGRAGPLLGAHALGFVLAGALLLHVRSMLFRQRALTVAVMSIIFSLTASIVTIFIFTVHAWYERVEIVWFDLPLGKELLRQAGIALYTGLIGWPLGRVLLWSAPLWGFRAPSQRASLRR